MFQASTFLVALIELGVSKLVGKLRVSVNLTQDVDLSIYLHPLRDFCNLQIEEPSEEPSDWAGYPYLPRGRIWIPNFIVFSNLIQSTSE